MVLDVTTDSFKNILFYAKCAVSRIEQTPQPKDYGVFQGAPNQHPELGRSVSTLCCSRQTQPLNRPRDTNDRLRDALLL